MPSATLSGVSKFWLFQYQLPASPWLIYTTPDYSSKTLSVSVTYDSSYNLTGGSVHRDVGCLYQFLYLYTPNGQLSSGSLPTGTTTFPVSQLHAHNLFTVVDVLYNISEITAGP